MNWKNLLSHKRLTRNDKGTVDLRNRYESDFGRLIFSPATRRLHDKTQVFPLTTDDNIHSRLTHSLEVMSIGHSLGIKVIENVEFRNSIGLDKAELLRTIPTILKCTCLVHDIGNPPFGHFGETVIKTFFSSLFEKQAGEFNLNEEMKTDFTEFDGNAQGFRILTKLQVLQDTYGLNLTCATLASFLKYPNADKIDRDILAKKKKGVFYSEKSHFEQIIDECGLKVRPGVIARHPLSFLMEAADSICYLVMDIEDGFNKGWYTYNYLRNYLSTNISDEKVFLQLFKSSDEVSGKNEKNTRIVKLRISLISYLVSLTVDNFINKQPLIMAGKYNKELIEDDPNKLAQSLNKFCVNEIFTKRDIEYLELTGHSVLNGLLNYYIEYIFSDNEKYADKAINLMSRSIKHVALLEQHKDSFKDLDPYYKLRAIVDYLTGMTDQFALKHYQKLSGQKIN